MSGDGEPPAATAGLYGRGDRDGGGKMRRDRKPPSTPYDRPQPPRRWISRLVDPAKRLISGGATRLLPSLFSAPNSTSDEADEVQTEVEHETRDCNQNFSPDVSQHTPSGSFCPNDKGKSKLEITHNDGPDKAEDQSEGGQPDIEQLINGKTFSGDEIDRLMEIMRSRVVDVEQDRKVSSQTGGEEIEEARTSHETAKGSVLEKEETDIFRLASRTPLPLASVQDDIAASPVDIARAYMDSRGSGMSFTSASLTWKNEKLGLTREHLSRPFMLSPRPKEPIRWPGAITQNQEDYSTPQTQKSRFGIHSSPRTPYSRTMYTRSKSKLTSFRADSERLVNVSLTPLPQMENHYLKSVSNAAEGSYGSGGPIRRSRNKFTSGTPARESAFKQSVQRSPFSKELSSGLMPKRNYEPGTSSASNFEPLNSKATSSEAGVTSVHPHSSKLASQILEQINRPVTLKQRSKELELASSSKNPHSAALADPVQKISSLGVAGAGISISIDVNGAKPFAQENHGKTALLQQKPDNVDSNAGEDVTAGFMVKLDKTSVISNGSDELPPGFQKPQLRARVPEQASNNLLPSRSFLADGQSKVLDITTSSTRSEQQNANRKPLLPSINVNKPGLRNSFSSDSSAGFSFPVTTSSNTFSDLPTPTVMPTSLTGAPEQSDLSGNPPMTCGKITIAPPVFSFPFTSPASDGVAPKFKFGSGKARLSFALEEHDATHPPDDGPVINYRFGSGKSRLNFGSIGAGAVCC